MHKNICEKSNLENLCVGKMWLCWIFLLCYSEVTQSETFSNFLESSSFSSSIIIGKGLSLSKNILGHRSVFWMHFLLLTFHFYPLAFTSHSTFSIFSLFPPSRLLLALISNQYLKLPNLHFKSKNLYKFLGILCWHVILQGVLFLSSNLVVL